MSRTQEPTVFLVDDDHEVQSALRWLINSVDLTVETFDSAEAFLDAVGPERPGCLVLDVRMPGMGGLGLLENLRSLGYFLPVIVLTGYADVPVAIRALKAGAIDFFEKPCTVRIPTKPATQSTPNRPPSPMQNGHPHEDGTMQGKWS